MKKIDFLNMPRLNNGEHYQFHFEFKKITDGNEVIKTKLGPLYVSYIKAYEAEETARQVEVGSILTKTISQSDDYRDMLEYGFALNVESKLYHYDLATRVSGERIFRILEQHGDLRRLSYNQESAAMTARNNLLQTKYQSDLEVIGNTEWLTRIIEANTEFINHFGERANEEGARISGNVRNARIVVDPAYDAIINRVNALAEVNGDQEYAEYFDQVNYYINYYKIALATRKAKKNPTDPADPAVA